MSIAALILIAANLVPIVGVLWWGWDAFILLMLYWMETAIIGFWTIFRAATEPVGEGTVGVLGALWTAGFFTVHAGIFMSVHFVLLWTFFGGAWSPLIHNVGDFIRVMVIGTDLWLPLLILFLVRGGMTLWPRIAPRLGFVSDQLPPPRKRNRNYISDLYVRIVVMQLAIIAGAWFAQEVAPGAAWPLILLILLKTAVDAGSTVVSRYFRVEAGGHKA